MTNMYNPPHAGEVLKVLYLDPKGLGCKQASKLLGISEVELSGLLEARNDMTLDLAEKIAKAFGGSVQKWMNMQAKYTEWHKKS